MRPHTVYASVLSKSDGPPNHKIHGFLANFLWFPEFTLFSRPSTFKLRHVRDESRRKTTYLALDWFVPRMRTSPTRKCLETRSFLIRRYFVVVWMGRVGWGGWEIKSCLGPFIWLLLRIHAICIRLFMILQRSVQTSESVDVKRWPFKWKLLAAQHFLVMLFIMLYSKWWL